MISQHWIIIRETDDWIIDYDLDNKRYRVSYFEEGHYKDEVIFYEYRTDTVC